MVRKLLKKMARPEGFEPPTPRSVVRSNPESDKPAEGKSSFYRGFSPFLLRLISRCFMSVWKQNGNIELTSVWLQSGVKARSVADLLNQQGDNQETENRRNGTGEHDIVRW